MANYLIYEKTVSIDEWFANVRKAVNNSSILGKKQKTPVRYKLNRSFFAFLLEKLTVGAHVAYIFVDKNPRHCVKRQWYKKPT